MNIMKNLLVAAASVMIATAPVVAQETPASGTPAVGGATWAAMPVGSHILIGGLIFVVTVTGLVLLDDDDNKSGGGSTPPPPPPTTTTTTT